MLPRNENTPGRHAGRAGVEAKTERQRFHREIKVGIGANDDGVAAAQFHRGRNQVRSELRENLFTRGRRAGEQNFVRARGNGSASRFRRFWQQSDELRIESGAGDQVAQCSGRGRCRRHPA